jgi:hypothetical protein
VREADAFEAFERDALFGARERKQAAQRGVIAETTHQHVLQRAQAFDELMALEDHAGLAAMPMQRAAIAETADALDVDAPGRRPVEKIQAAQQRRLAGPRGAEQDRELALPETQAGRVQTHGAARIGDADVFQFDHDCLPFGMTKRLSNSPFVKRIESEAQSRRGGWRCDETWMKDR